MSIALMSIHENILEQVIAATAEPLIIIRVDHPDWPVALTNRAFEAIQGDSCRDQPFADVIEQLVGREFALDVAEAIRSEHETSFPFEQAGKDYLLALKPLTSPGESGARYCVAYWRGSGGNSAMASSDTHHALLKAKRRIRDLARDDAVTGLLNDRAFMEILQHDWAVAAREQSSLSVVIFTLDDFKAYVDVFGRHAADSCLRRVGQTIRRCLRRASDVVGRINGAQFAVLSHASDEHSVNEFAERICAAVRELGMHHPRSNVAKFVTVSYEVGVGPDGDIPAADFLERLLSRAAD
jgi:diguanylate cyclase (GGDEF)-like protein